MAEDLAPAEDPFAEPVKAVTRYGGHPRVDRARWGRFFKALRQGAEIKPACAIANIGYGTVLHRLQTNKRFAQRVWRAKQNVVASVEQTYLKAILTPDRNGKFDTKAIGKWLANRSPNWKEDPDETRGQDELPGGDVKGELYYESGVDKLATVDRKTLRSLAHKLLTQTGEVTDADYTEIRNEPGEN